MKPLLHHLIYQRINSPCEKSEAPRVGAPWFSSCLFLTYLYEVSHMGWVLNFGEKSEAFGMS